MNNIEYANFTHFLWVVNVVIIWHSSASIWLIFRQNLITICICMILNNNITLYDIDFCILETFSSMQFKQMNTLKKKAYALLNHQKKLLIIELVFYYHGSSCLNAFSCWLLSDFIIMFVDVSLIRNTTSCYGKIRYFFRLDDNQKVILW